MVYESDFYTTRRPYSRPTVTSYSVTDYVLDDDYLGYPYAHRVQPYHRNIPAIGHKRLVIVQPSAHGWRVKQSSLLGEIDRIYHKVRPSLAYQPKEDYLNSKSITDFDDETRSIRAKTAEILKKIHTPVPRAQRPIPLPGEAIDQFLKLRHELSNVAMKLIFYPTQLDNNRIYYSHTELPITERIMCNNYIDRLLSSNKYSVPAITHYEEPRHYSRLGNGHLACLTYAGGRPIARRRNLASVEDYIRDDINVLSHYSRFRQAAEKAPHVPDTEYGSIPHMPPTKSPITGSWKSNAPRRTQSDKVTSRIPSSGDDEATQERKKKRREEVEEAALKEAEEEKRRAQELKRQEELAEQAAAERQAEFERKAREEEEERILREETERLEALKKAQEEEERKAREEEEARLAKEEEERKAKEAEEAKRKAEEERKAREEEERRLREEEEERKAKEEEERQAREEEERRLKEEEERRLKEEEEKRLKEEEERMAREEEERRIKEEEERLAREEEENKKALEAEEEKPEESEVEEPVEEAAVEEINEPAEEETGNEPVVEEPSSPEEAPVSQTHPPADAEEEEEEEEEEE